MQLAPVEVAAGSGKGVGAIAPSVLANPHVRVSSMSTLSVVAYIEQPVTTGILLYARVKGEM